MRRFCVLFILLTLFTQLPVTAQSTFVTVSGTDFYRNGKPYHYIGTNFWYGPILASKGQGGDRKRLCKELDLMKSLGIDNLRIQVGVDSIRLCKSSVPFLQLKPGVYNDTILDGLDYLLAEMGKRNMVAILALNNSWEWSGGYSFYLYHAGAGQPKMPSVDGYPAFMNYVRQFATNKKAQQLFFNYVRFIISRTNRYTGTKYSEDPAIMSWQIGNEPRCFGEAEKQPFVEWLRECSKLIRSLDGNHLISLGSEGSWGCENDMQLYKKICEDPNIDYCNIHLWPYNWGWAKKDSLKEDVGRSCTNAEAYINEHISLCNQLNKPLVLEEFGLPRDGFSFSPQANTQARDAFYNFIFNLIRKNVKQHSSLIACNFWAWGGLGKPQNTFWMNGDDFLGDPPQEEQGLNSVFATDKETLKLIKKYNKELR